MTHRYIRQQILPEIGEAGQLKLHNSKVLIIGIGGLGCTIAEYVAGAGISEIGLMDFDTVDVTNLHRQVLFNEDDIGKKKVEAAALYLQKYNSSINYTAYPERLSEKNCKEILARFDLIIDATDDSRTKFLINDTCVQLEKTLIYGALHQYHSQVSVFNMLIDTERGPNLRCLFPQEESIPLPNCSEAGILGPVAGLAGSIMALEALKVLVGISPSLSGKLLIINTLTWEQKILRIKRSKYTPLLRKENIVKNQKTADTITVKEVHNLIQNNTPIQLIDVRELHEKAIADIGGELISMGTIEKHIDNLRKDIPLIIYCRTGGRSATVTKLLREQYNFSNAMNLTGGIYAWAKEIDPTLTLY